MTPVMNALAEVDKAYSNDGDGTNARNEVAAEARKELEQRVRTVTLCGLYRGAKGRF